MLVVCVALLPLAVAIFLISVWRCTSRQAGLAALLVASLLTQVGPFFPLPPLRLVLAFGQGVGTSLSILAVIFPALLLYQIQREQGGLDTVARALARISPDQDLQVLLLVLGLAPFLESLCGFGIGIIAIAPLLLKLRIDRLRVALLCLLSQLTTAWGAMGVAMSLAATLSGIPAWLLGEYTGLLLLPATVGLSLVVLFVSGGTGALRRWWWCSVGSAMLLAGGALPFSRFFGVELVGVLTGALSLALLCAVGAITASGFGQRDHLLSGEPQGKAHGVVLGRALFPYVSLSVLLLLSHGISPLRSWLQSHLVVSLPVLSLAPLYNPGFCVALVALVALVAQPGRRAVLSHAFPAAWKQFLPIAITSVSFLATAQVMQTSAMTGTLGSAAAVLGDRYSWVAPGLAALGGWLTGSNVGSNAMFVQLQRAAALSTGLPLVWLIAAQNAASSIARMLSPTILALTITATALEGRESRLLKMALAPAAWAFGCITCVLVAITSPSVLAVLFAITLPAWLFISIRPPGCIARLRGSLAGTGSGRAAVHSKDVSSQPVSTAFLWSVPGATQQPEKQASTPVLPAVSPACESGARHHREGCEEESRAR